MIPPPPELRSDRLWAVWSELLANGEKAEELAAGLTPEQLRWRPEPGRWSVGECLDHLVLTGEAYLEVLDEAIEEGRRRGVRAEGPYRRSLVGRFLTWTLEPPPRLKVPAPEVIRPRASGADGSAGGRAAGRPARAGASDEGDGPGPADPLPRFLALRARLGRRLEAADGLDLGRIRVTSPFIAFARFDLGSAFRMVAAHERRHLWQAGRVLEAEGFPSA
ncbi:MAG: DinB family protein [Gemmatimonadota bacterium]